VHGAAREEIEMGRGRRRGLTMVAPTGGAIQAAAQLPERRREGEARFAIGSFRAGLI